MEGGTVTEAGVQATRKSHQRIIKGKRALQKRSTTMEVTRKDKIQNQICYLKRSNWRAHLDPTRMKVVTQVSNLQGRHSLKRE